MRARSHVVIGCAAWAGLTSLGGLPLEPVGLGLATLGALLPDIDHPHSWVGRRLPWLSLPLSALLGHRGVTHSLLAVGLGLGLLLVQGAGWLAAPIVLGYLSHILADGLTNSGVPLFWPSRRLYTARLFCTGGLGEHAAMALLVVLIGGLL